MKLTFDIVPLPTPTKTVEEYMEWAVVFSDQSGVLALCRDDVWAHRFANWAWDNHMRKNGFVNKPIVTQVKVEI